MDIANGGKNLHIYIVYYFMQIHPIGLFSCFYLQYTSGTYVLRHWCNEAFSFLFQPQVYHLQFEFVLKDVLYFSLERNSFLYNIWKSVLYRICSSPHTFIFLKGKHLCRCQGYLCRFQGNLKRSCDQIQILEYLKKSKRLLYILSLVLDSF